MTALAPRTGFAPAVAAVYAGQVARARVARAPLLFVAGLQSIGLLVLLRGVIDDDLAERRQVVAGAAVLVIAFVALNLLAQRFGHLRAHGGLDYYAALGTPPSAVVLGTAASYATFAIPSVVVTAVTGALLYDLPLARLWVLAPVAVLGGAALAGVGAALGLLAPKPEIATVAGQLGMTVVLFLSLVRPAGPLRPVAALVPSTYAVEALREAFAPHPSYGALAGDLAVCAAVAAAALAVAAVAFRRAVGR